MRSTHTSHTLAELIWGLSERRFECGWRPNPTAPFPEMSVWRTDINVTALSLHCQANRIATQLQPKPNYVWAWLPFGSPTYAEKQVANEES